MYHVLKLKIKAFVFKERVGGREGGRGEGLLKVTLEQALCNRRHSHYSLIPRELVFVSSLTVVLTQSLASVHGLSRV